LKVGLIGFGRTGRSVATILLESNKTNLQWIIRQSSQLENRSIPEFLGIDSDNPALIYRKDDLPPGELLNRHPVDAIIDFSSESGLDYYGDEAAKRKITIVSAISHYENIKLKKLEELAKHTVVMHSPNITLGINFIMIAAKILKNIAPHTDIIISEEHFKAKTEISGTAKILARELDVPDEDIKAVRAGGITGVHEILFGFPHQTVRLKHETIAPEAFGNGILFAIENLKDKPRGFYRMEDIFIPYFKLQERKKRKIPEMHRKPWWQFWKN
jgi:4-hydroxy-tetrahydrodipicolinate reductase